MDCRHVEFSIVESTERLFAWEIAVIHLAQAAFLAVTIFGIPFAQQHVKLIPVALFPFERELR